MRYAAALVPFVALLAIACGGGGGGGEREATATPQPTATPRPLPSPVAYRQEPAAGYTLGDPNFEALPGARAYFGRLGGSIYQIEIPDRWNGTLVLYMHGSRDLYPVLFIDQPNIRSHLIRNGVAWGASSFSDNNLKPGLGADETAALWDYFVQQFGRPARTYVTGESMGGAATYISAERYANRYDGALALCGYAGQAAQSATIGNYVVAGAYAAGITQEEFDRLAPVDLVNQRIRPALHDPPKRQAFENLLADLTGGPRRFDREGYALEEEHGWNRGAGLMFIGVYDNQDTVYRLGPSSGVSSDAFNLGAIRVKANPASVAAWLQNNEITGDLQMPVLAMFTTGDGQVPISHAQVLRRKVSDAGKSDLLVERAVQESRHCGFTKAEWEQGLEDLIAWVEQGTKPDGEDLSGDLSNAGRAFTLAPRFGSPEADDVPGADGRVTVSGRMTLDGQPVAGEVYVVVVKDGLRRYCSLSRVAAAADGRYEVAVASDGEARGCGQPGAQLYLDVYVPSRGRSFWSQELADWPHGGGELRFDGTLSDPGAYRPNTAFRGEVVDADGEPLPAGTIIEAYIGATLCGVTSLSPTAMALGDPGSYFLAVVGRESIAGCEAGGTVAFRVNGTKVQQTGINDFDGRFYGRHVLDLTVP